MCVINITDQVVWFMRQAAGSTLELFKEEFMLALGVPGAAGYIRDPEGASVMVCTYLNLEGSEKEQHEFLQGLAKAAFDGGGEIEYRGFDTRGIREVVCEASYRMVHGPERGRKAFAAALRLKSEEIKHGTPDQSRVEVIKADVLKALRGDSQIDKIMEIIAEVRLADQRRHGIEVRAIADKLVKQRIEDDALNREHSEMLHIALSPLLLFEKAQFKLSQLKKGAASQVTLGAEPPAAVVPSVGDAGPEVQKQ